MPHTGSVTASMYLKYTLNVRAHTLRAHNQQAHRQPCHRAYGLASLVYFTIRIKSPRSRSPGYRISQHFSMF